MTIFLAPQTLHHHLAAHGLGHHAHAILALGQGALGLKADSKRQLSIGASRFGGLPDLSPDATWPHGNSGALSFLLQINCQELAELDEKHILPHEGMLYFFYDVINQPWGIDVVDKRGAVVMYTPTNQGLAMAAAPDGLDHEEGILPKIGLGFTDILPLDEYPKVTLKKAGLTEQDCTAYFNLYDALTDQSDERHLPAHRLIGTPDEIQGAMEDDCAQAYNAQHDELESTPSEWRLLLQLDSDDDLGVMWGDCGMLYFWIRESDLKNLNFADTWTVLQCY